MKATKRAGKKCKNVETQDVKLGLKAQTIRRSKRHIQNSISIKKCKKGLKGQPQRSSAGQQSPEKLSTLDNWLQTLYKSQSLEPTGTAGKCDNNNAVAHSIIIRLEKLKLSQPKSSTNNNNLNNGENKHINRAQRRTTPEGVFYKDRSSEYIRLGSKDYKCIKCDFTHCNLVSMRAHFDKEHNDKVFECKICPFKTRQQYYFNSHVRYHSRPDAKCPHCKKMIKWFSYKMHIKTHERNKEAEYHCKICDYRSYNRANVKRHALALHRNPDDTQTFMCNTCSYVTILEDRLNQHKKLVHSTEGMWLPCPHCDYTTRNKSHLTRHVNDLHKEKGIQCSECSRLFSSKENLKYHVRRRHTDLSARKYYFCELCPKDEQYKTTEKGNLARHMLAHRTLDEIEMFACHKCPYLGKSRNALKTHLINAHLPEMHSYKCKLCGYSTSTKSRFDHHKRDVHGKPKSEIVVHNVTNQETTNKEGPNISVKGESDNVYEFIEITDDDDEVDTVDTSIPQLKLADLWAKQENHQG